MGREARFWEKNESGGVGEWGRRSVKGLLGKGLRGVGRGGVGAGGEYL